MEEEFVAANMYDKMINWDTRLSREIPVISQYFKELGDNALILDVACSSGRHSFALNKEGFQTVGIDISPSFIQLANQIRDEMKNNASLIADKSEFVEINAADMELIEKFKGRYFDGAILLGNAIANMGDFATGKALLQNIFILLRPGGKFFVQTVNKPLKPWYNPLRRKNDVILQRIMVPSPDTADTGHNMVLHVNQIDAINNEYIAQKADNLFFMYRVDEFEALAKSIGFDVEEVYSGYERNNVENIDGETLIWELSKPEIMITPEGRELFQTYSDMDVEEIKNTTLDLWQDLIAENWYHCIRGYRFLFPRIKANPKYQQFINEKSQGPILDVACFVGTDLRQLWVDGVRNLVGIDLSEVFINNGYKLFKDGNRDNGAKIEFIVADIVSPEFLEVNENNEVSGDFERFYEYFAGIHAGSLIHLLEKQEIEFVVKRMYHLLQQDGVFFGRTVGSVTPGNHMSGLRYLHSVNSLRSLFNSVGYSEVDVFVIPRGGPKGESSTSTVLQIGFYVRK